MFIFGGKSISFRMTVADMELFNPLWNIVVSRVNIFYKVLRIYILDFCPSEFYFSGFFCSLRDAVTDLY